MASEGEQDGQRALITRVEITRLRGIREGELDGLAPLTILVGQNGSGKSTILDALLLGTGYNGTDDIERVVGRRRHIDVGAPWLLWRCGDDGSGRVDVRSAIGYERSTHVTIKGDGGRFAVTLDCEDNRTTCVFPRDRYGDTGLAFDPMGGAPTTARLIEPAMGGHLDILLSEATRRGGRRAIEALLAQVIDDFESVQMLVDANGKPEVHFEYPWGSVPIALAGDGLHALARLCFMVAAPQDALLLIEEPEVHMHPRALRASGEAIAESVRQGNQVVISTHSLDLIDHMLDAADERQMLEDVVVIRTLIVDGVLRKSVFPGPQARFAREQIEEDLR